MHETASIDDVILPLRRYARAITGSTQVADGFLASCIDEALSLLKSGQDLHRAMWFHILDKFLREWAKAQQRSEQAIAERRAFLLFAMEELSVPEVAIVLETSEEEAANLIAEAEQNLTKLLKTSVMIIEDEPMIAALLTKTVQDLEHTCVGAATTARQAVDLARETTPGLILSDVRLAEESSGIAAAAEIREFLPDTPIIFITAYPESFLQGEDGEPEYLIPKPFQPQYVQAVISQALLAHRG